MICISDIDYDGRNDIKLKGPLYIGGIDAKLKKSKSLGRSGLQLRAFEGCLKNIRINYR